MFCIKKIEVFIKTMKVLQIFGYTLGFIKQKKKYDSLKILGKNLHNGSHSPHFTVLLNTYLWCSIGKLLFGDENI